MAENKDFLGSLAGEIEKKPASFQEERVEQYQPKKKSPGLIIGAVVGLLAVSAAVYFLFFAPKIIMENFVGRSTADFSAWAKQNGIVSTGILLNKEYSMEYDADVIMEQSVAEGTKIKKDAKITFTVSQGADPSELVTFPDLKNMSYSEITAWVKTNKLSNTKVSTVYDNTVPENAVISYELKSISESEFTRGSTLTISVSKGVKPAATITVNTDYVNQAYTTLQSWAASNKLELKMTEKYDAKIAQGNIISLSVKSGDKLKEGSVITVEVSKGPAVVMENFTDYTEAQVTKWCSKNSVACEIGYEYNASQKKGLVTYQSIGWGKTLKEDSEVVVRVSLGKPSVSSFTGGTVEDLNAWVAEQNEKGAQLSVGTPSYEINEGVAAGTIIRIANASSVNVGSQLQPVVSEGKNIWMKEDWNAVVASPNTFDEATVRTMCTADGVSCRFSYANDAAVNANKVVSIARSDGKVLNKDSYITEITTINIVICDK